MPDHSPLLVAERLSKHYGGVKALSDVSFALSAGQTLGVIGPNGAGKSTLLALLSGGARPTSGSVTWRGARIDQLPNHRVARLGIGRARQVPRPFRRLTVRQNLEVAANAAVADATRREALVTRTLADCGLLERQHLAAGALGLLDLKRLEVARALAVEPQLLLLDEVAGGLIGAEVQAIAGLIERIQARGIAIVIVEHVQGVIGRLADRAIALDWGSVIAEGTPAQVSANEKVIQVYFGDPGQGSVAPTAPAQADVERPAVLTVRNLCVRYGGLAALQDVDLTLGQGEVVGIIGANGAGKTTLCRAIAGLVPTQGGRVTLFGADVSYTPAHLRARSGLAICHEGRRLFTGLTVMENLELGAAFSGATRAQVDERLARVTQMFPILAARAQGLAGAMSGGQQQMLAIGRALMSAPKVLLLDELSLGLAPLVIESIYQALAGIRALGVSILLVEQNTHRCLAVADRVYVLERGRISYSGTPDGLLGNDLLRQAYFGPAH
jgi:branched-chain amino acid transport system ATP-binding protein